MLTIVGIAAAPDRRRNRRVGEGIGVPHRQVPLAAIAVMNQAIGRISAAVVNGVLKR